MGESTIVECLDMHLDIEIIKENAARYVRHFLSLSFST